MNSRSILRSQIMGWAAVSISTLTACFWALWGVAENFHEGWYFVSVWQNLGLLIVQYLSPMLVLMLMSVVAVCWPRVALPVLGIVALGIGWFFRGGHSAIELVVLPLLMLGALYFFGRPRPRNWALTVLITLPLLTAIICGVYPGWQALHRLDDGNYGMRRVEGNGVTLVWAPEGPGWPARGTSWENARKSCALLTRDGHALADVRQHVWRLPTVEEAVRSLVYRGRNAGGTWDSTLQHAEYQVTPDKDSPLWKVHSIVIYWWTDTETDSNRAYYITNNGAVFAHTKRSAGDYTGFRCVCDPSEQSVVPVVQR